MSGAWNSEIYRETGMIVLAFLFVSGLIVYFLRRKNHYFIVSWASIKSWLFVAPLLFIIFGLPEPWPLIFVTGFSILGAKIFFQLMGMYHRSYFVLICYAAIVGLGFCVWLGRVDLYNLLPMIVLGVSLLVPLVRNNYKRMIQYISITSLAFVLLGWSFMHVGFILRFPNGVYELMYLLILTEFCDNTNLAISRSIGRWKLFNRIDNKRSVESTLLSAVLTILLAFGMRHLLPDRSEVYWLTSGVVASIGGLFGDLIMTVIRRDAGIKITGAFILGRGDFLHRMDRLIFVAPAYYYVMNYLHTVQNL